MLLVNKKKPSYLELKALCIFISFFLCSFLSSQTTTQTYIDNFNAGTYTYSNSNGSQNWSTDWIEVGDSDLTPATDYISVANNRLEMYWIWGENIRRSVDLSTADTATLSFDWQTNSLTSTTRLAIQVSSNGGSSYTTIGYLTGTTTGSFSQDISTYISNNTTIRFASIDNNWSSDDFAYLDNITITAAIVNNPPILTVTGDQEYCPGTSQPIVETISITDPDDTTTDAIYIQISSGYINGEDILNLTGTHPSITATWDATEGELSLVGPATFAEFEAAILDVEFSSSAASPSGVRQFSITPGSANYLPPTDHYYEFVSDVGITWTAARDAAALRTYYGLQGYLATLTTQAEADFSGAQAVGVGWIGASDAATEGDWRWVTGPEAGTSFWSGGAGGTTVAPYNFAYWNGSEPNNSGNEDYAHIADPSVIRGTGGPGSWNDLPNAGGGGAYAPQGYVVEYGGTAGDPVLSITGVTMLTIDNVDPTASNPIAVTVYCSSDVPSSDITVVTDEADNCTTNPIVTFVSDSSDGGSNPEIITRTYRVTDEVGNFIDVAQTITVNPILIDSQPTNQVVGIGNNGTLSSSTSNADTFQW